MNLIRVFTIIASISTSQAHIHQRNLRKDPKEEDHLCAFNETAFNFSVPDGAWCNLGEDLMVGIDYPDRTPQEFPDAALWPNKIRFPFPRGLGGFINLAFWLASDKENTIQCYDAKGFRRWDAVLVPGEDPCNSEDDFCNTAVAKGHVFWIALANDIIDEEGTKNVQGVELKVPGLYWMQGGTTYEIYHANGTDQTEPYFELSEAKGKWEDICEKISSA